MNMKFVVVLAVLLGVSSFSAASTSAIGEPGLSKIDFTCDQVETDPSAIPTSVEIGLLKNGKPGLQTILRSNPEMYGTPREITVWTNQYGVNFTYYPIALIVQPQDLNKSHFPALFWVMSMKYPMACHRLALLTSGQ